MRTKDFTVRLEEDVKIEAGNAVLDGNLCIPVGARGIVAFVHGSGSSRLSPRNRLVADYLNRKGLATLLFDLLTRPEERIDEVTRELRFDIEFLAGRVVEATKWMQNDSRTADLEIGYFGASTGAAAALVGASVLQDTVKAIVSRGGRPDLAFSALSRVTCPSLLIVGQKDPQVLALNRQVLDHLPPTTIKSVAIIPGASHLFEEEGTLEMVCVLAADWFGQYLGGQRNAA